MAIRSIRFQEEVDNRPDDDRGWDSLLPQGETVTNYKIFEVKNDDGSTQHLKLEIIINSYGDAEGVGELSLATPRQKTVTVWS